ncbi:hypothetical protein Emed_002843 [Eimeria media]
MSICSNNFPGEPPLDEYRIYMGTVIFSWKVRSVPRVNIRLIRYEIGCRFNAPLDDGAKREEYIGSAVTKAVTSGYTLSSLALYTPADYIELNARPNNWETFDFTGPVCMLGAWLAALTWAPNTSLQQFAPQSAARLVPISAQEELAFISHNCVVISHKVHGAHGLGCYWALVAACAMCGATVGSDSFLNANSWMSSAFGYGLWRNILDALRLLGAIYDRAGGGELFAFALAKGLHSVNTVVAHSDEGGLMRDILREC